jgi:hypothetical protein
MWSDGIRDLTPEEEKLIHDYVLSKCDKGWEETGEALVKEILADEYTKMDFLDFAKRNAPNDLCSMQQYVWTD